MSTGKLCLKARPTARQLADRFRPIEGVWPDGLELYLDAADLADEPTMDGVVQRVEAALEQAPDGFALLIEGPVGSLDSGFFDVTRESEADTLVVERLASLAKRLGARAVNIHEIAPSDDLSRLTMSCHDDLLRRSVPFVRRFVELVSAAGAVPTVENMPPVLRMRQGGFFFTPIGMASEDLLWLADAVPGLAILPDTSHAGLYLNARRTAALPTAQLPGELEGHAWVEPLLGFVRQLPEEPDSLLGYFQRFGTLVANAQVSNASGILGEGLPYAEGDFDLDPTIRWLGGHSDHVVTETLEPDQDDARYMRDALVRMRSVLKA